MTGHGKVKALEDECDCGSGYDLGFFHYHCIVCGKKICSNCGMMSCPEDIENKKFYCNDHRPYNYAANQSSTTEEFQEEEIPECLDDAEYSDDMGG